MNETIVKTEKLTELKNLVSEIERLENLILNSSDLREYSIYLEEQKIKENKLNELIKTL